MGKHRMNQQWNSPTYITIKTKSTTLYFSLFVFLTSNQCIFLQIKFQSTLRSYIINYVYFIIFIRNIWNNDISKISIHSIRVIRWVSHETGFFFLGKWRETNGFTFFFFFFLRLRDVVLCYWLGLNYKL